MIIEFPRKVVPIHPVKAREPARLAPDKIAGSLFYPMVALTMIGAMLPFLPLAAVKALMGR